MGDLIDRQAVLDAIVQCTNCGDEDTLREYVLKHSLDNGWTGGILEALDAVKDLPPAQPEPQHGRVFKGIVVEYPEYKGKPYFSIKYTENGQEFIGYSTYKLEVLSEYLKKYFMSSAQPEPKEGHWIDKGWNGDWAWQIDGRGNCWRVIECSECGKSVSVESNYCPHCGADMRGEQDGNA